MIDNADAGILARCSLFRGLDGAQIRSLLGAFTADIRDFSEDQMIAQRGDEWTSLWVLVGGQIRAEIHDPSGKNLHIETLRVPDALAPAVIFASEPFLPVSLRAEVSGRALVIAHEDVLGLMARAPVFLSNYLQELGDKVNFLADKVRFFRFSSLKEKVARYLLDQRNRRGTSRFRLPYSLESLADLFGVARPSLSRVLGELDRDGIITRDKGIFEILKVEELKVFFSD